MSRIEPVSVSEAAEGSRPLLEGIQRSLGMVPNMVKTLAHSPAALGAYGGFRGPLGRALTARLREQIALVVAGANGCDYCASAHTALGVRAGLDQAELAANLEGESADEGTREALRFARAIVEQRGRITDEDVDRLRMAGYSDEQVVEIIAVTAWNVFTNYFNLAVATEVDFPLVDTARAFAKAG